MTQYSNELIKRAAARLLPPESEEISSVYHAIGESLAILEQWRADALSRSPQERAWTSDLARHIDFFNIRRPHTALSLYAPDAVYTDATLFAAASQTAQIH